MKNRDVDHSIPMFRLRCPCRPLIVLVPRDSLTKFDSAPQTCLIVSFPGPRRHETIPYVSTLIRCVRNFRTQLQSAVRELRQERVLVMTLCCRCNAGGECRNCVCVKSKRQCSNCLPSRKGCCSNMKLSPALQETDVTRLYLVISHTRVSRVSTQCQAKSPTPP